jgi:predicted CXXCH cytochrome family protein
VTATGKEISCVSCHLPHGSANESLLKVEGGAMVSCLECHQR